MRKNQLQNITVFIEKDEDGTFIGSVPSIPSCYAQGKTQQLMLKELQKVIALCLRNQEKVSKNEFIGIQNITFSHA